MAVDDLDAVVSFPSGPWKPAQQVAGCYLHTFLLAMHANGRGMRTPSLLEFVLLPEIIQRRTPIQEQPESARRPGPMRNQIQSHALWAVVKRNDEPVVERKEDQACGALLEFDG